MKTILNIKISLIYIATVILAYFLAPLGPKVDAQVLEETCYKGLFYLLDFLNLGCNIQGFLYFYFFVSALLVFYFFQSKQAWKIFIFGTFWVWTPLGFDFLVDLDMMYGGKVIIRFFTLLLFFAFGFSLSYFLRKVTNKKIKPTEIQIAMERNKVQKPNKSGGFLKKWFKVWFDAAFLTLICWLIFAPFIYLIYGPYENSGSLFIIFSGWQWEFVADSIIFTNWFLIGFLTLRRFQSIKEKIISVAIFVLISILIFTDIFFASLLLSVPAFGLGYGLAFGIRKLKKTKTNT